MITRVRAGWVVPIAGPVVPGGWIDVDAARSEIVAVGAAGAASVAEPARVIDLPDAVILPGLVNAHTHLELSHMAGAVPPADSFVAWVRSMIAVRFGAPASAATVTDAVARAIGQMEATGTVGVGDIGNTEVAVRPLAASSLHGVHFKEALGFRAADAGQVGGQARLEALVSHKLLMDLGCRRISASVAPHAPYSTSAQLIQALAAGMPAGGVLDTPVPACPISSIHLGESAEEIEFLVSATGPFRGLLADLGAWDPDWQPPGVRPVTYIAGLRALHAGLLVVHGTQLAADELQAVARAGATLVLCARSNRWVGAGTPPVADAFATGGRVAIGTDSLASVADLNLFAELAHLRQVAPRVPAPALLRAATLGGAEALGCGRLGALGHGMTARALVRTPPAGVADVEEWLVADAVDTSDLRWLDEIVARAAV